MHHQHARGLLAALDSRKHAPADAADLCGFVEREPPCTAQQPDARPQPGEIEIRLATFAIVRQCDFFDSGCFIPHRGIVYRTLALLYIGTTIVHSRRVTLSGMGTFITPGPLDLVTFDLYDTLIELKPPRWERLSAAAAQIGIEADV